MGETGANTAAWLQQAMGDVSQRAQCQVLQGERERELHTWVWVAPASCGGQLDTHAKQFRHPATCGTNPAAPAHTSSDVQNCRVEPLTT